MKLVYILILLSFISCSENTQKLPFLGDYELVNGHKEYPKIRNFHLVDQDSNKLELAHYRNKIMVVDFIFLSCPTICPKMTSQMKIVYRQFEGEKSVQFLSHTIDPEKDSVSVLKSYCNSIGINNNQWKFATGNKSEIYDLAENSYFSIAYADSTAPGGFVHSGGILLIDKNKYVRGVYDGTNTNETKRLIRDIKILKEE